MAFRYIKVTNAPSEISVNHTLCRNEPCHCRSGLKFKCCHGATRVAVAEGEEAKARELQRQDQQGLGRPIISCVQNGGRYVSAGAETFFSRTWNVFPDFLLYYVKTRFGQEWLEAETAKPTDQQHPFLALYRDTAMAVNAGVQRSGNIAQIQKTGRIAAVLDLAYALYLLAHNARLQTLFLTRLKKKELFWPAAYEAQITGMLINAGFEIEFEDEADSTTDHVELTATYRESGRKFSVEAKRRAFNVPAAKVGRVLHKAFKHSAKHDMLIFIGTDLPPGTDSDMTVFKEVVQGIREQEERLTINGELAPSAYIIITNNPYDNCAHGGYESSAGIEGFKIPDLRVDSKFSSLEEMLASRERHLEVLALLQSITEHNVPITFDGEIPALAFGEHEPRLIIGDKYFVKGKSGMDEPMELLQAVVMERDKAAVCVMKDANDLIYIYQAQLSDPELEGYNQHPETFFGRVEPKPRFRDPIDAYDWFLATYGKASKETLLRLLKGHPQFHEISECDRFRLAHIYCAWQTTMLWSKLASADF